MAIITGTSGADTLTGGPENDQIDGLAGNDILRGGGGDNTLTGGDGDDSLVVTGARDIVLGGVGVDELSFGDTSAVTVDANLIGDYQTIAPGRMLLLSDRIESYSGTSGADRFILTPGADRYLSAGADIVLGGDGADNLTGFGAERLDGEAGDDVLTGGGRLFGGSGDDQITSEGSLRSFRDPQPPLPAAPFVVIDAGSGNDRLTLRSQVFDVNMGDGDDQISLGSLRGDGFYFPAYTNTGDIILGDGRDFVVNDSSFSLQDVGRIRILDFNVAEDQIVSRFNRTYQIGSDTYNSGLTFVGLRADTLTAANYTNGFLNPVWYLGTAGSEIFVGGPGADYYEALAGDDQVFGGVGDDVLEGGLGADTLRGEAGDDLLDGGNGANTLLGGSGNDRLTGGEDDDVIAPGEGSDRSNGGSGRNTLSYSDLSAGVYVEVRSTGEFTALKSTGTDLQTYNFIRVVGTDFNDGMRLLDSGGGRTLEGGDGSDHLIASTVGATLDGGAGEDALTGGRGNDVLIGGAGFDRMDSDTGADRFIFRLSDFAGSTTTGDEILRFQSGVDTLEFQNLTGFRLSLLSTPTTSTVTVREIDGPRVMTLQIGGAVAISDIVTGGVGLEIQGGALGDVLVGGPASDRIAGGPGDDNLNGALGADELLGEDGADQLFGGSTGDVLRGGEGADRLDGGSEGDTLFGGAGADVFLYPTQTSSPSSTPDTIRDFVSGEDRIDFSGAGVTEISVIRAGASSFIFATTQTGAMQIGVDGAVNGSDFDGLLSATYLVGGAAGDTLIGSTRSDPIQGGAGDDVIIGGLGADALYGEAGADTFRYRAAAESNASAYDSLFGFQTGLDTVDLSALGVGALGIVRQNGASFLFAQTAQGAVQLVAVTGDINLSDVRTDANIGGVMIGSALNDVLRGGAFGDSLDGGVGADDLAGGAGNDGLSGGAGADLFRFTRADLGGVDTVADFVSGQDRLDLRGLQLGSADRVGWVGSGGSTFLFVDMGGDGAADLVIQLAGLANLSSADVLLA